MNALKYESETNMIHLINTFFSGGNIHFFFYKEDMVNLPVIVKIFY